MMDLGSLKWGITTVNKNKFNLKVDTNLHCLHTKQIKKLYIQKLNNALCPHIHLKI